MPNLLMVVTNIDPPGFRSCEHFLRKLTQCWGKQCKNCKSMEKFFTLVTPPLECTNKRKCVFCERFPHVRNFCIFYPFLTSSIRHKSQFNFKIISISKLIINLTWGKYLGYPHALSLHLPPQHHNRVHPSSQHADGFQDFITVSYVPVLPTSSTVQHW